MSKKPREQDSLDNLVGQAMDGIVEEAARERAASETEEARQERRERRNAILAMTLVPLALILTVLNVTGFGARVLNAGVAPLGPAEAQVAAMEILSDAVDELQWELEDNGRYPARPGFLPDEPGDDEPFTYQLIDPTRYVLTVTIEGYAATFDSVDDADEVFREVRNER